MPFAAKPARERTITGSIDFPVPNLATGPVAPVKCGQLSFPGCLRACEGSEMRRVVRLAAKLSAVIVLALTSGLVEPAAATTYYIAANGADSNSGTSKTAPWLHAPGMSNCTATCGSTTPQAGDSFIFRGGDSWHTSNSSAVPYTGNVACGGGDAGTCGWYWSWSGTSTSCNFPTTASSCIYIGVDQTWYSGASWTRPQLNLDNPLWANSTHQDGSHVGWVTQCSYNDAAFTGLDVHANYVILDNFELLGKCWSSVKTYGADSELAENGSSGDVVEHAYFHGWTMTYTSGLGSVFDKAPMIGGRGTLQTLSYSVFDGSDAGPPCSASGNCSGDIADPSGTMGIANADHNVFRRIGNTTNGTSIFNCWHDNLFEYMYDSFDTTTHSDVLFTYGNYAASGSSSCFYNNMIRHVSTGQTIALDPPDAGKLYIFNNILFDVGNAGNCMQLQNTTANNATFYITNNTFDAPCTIAMNYNNNLMYARNSVVFQNNYFIGWTSLSQVIATGGNPYLTVTDNGNEVFQSEAAANGQGYVPANNYQPTSKSGATYQAGGNLSASCLAFSGDSALCSGSTGGVASAAGSGSVPAQHIYPPTARAKSWDAGAYQFQPNPPTGLTLTAQ